MYIYMHTYIYICIQTLHYRLQSAVQVVRKEVDMLSLPNMKYERLQLALQTAIAAQEFAQVCCSVLQCVADALSLPTIGVEN